MGIVKKLIELKDEHWYLSTPERALNKWYFYFAHRFIKSHQYNVVRIKSLEPGYYDPSEQILHAAFDVMAKYYEYNYIPVNNDNDRFLMLSSKKIAEKLLTEQDDFERIHLEISLSGVIELETLYNWWINERPLEIEAIDAGYPEDAKWELVPTSNNTSRMENNESFKKWADESYIREQAAVKKDNDMLIRLVGIRTSLWYL